MAVHRYMYTVEFEYDSLSAIRRDPDGTLTYIDRRVDGQDRLQVSPPRTGQRTVAPRGTCGVESFVVNGSTYFAAAAGCELPYRFVDDLTESACDSPRLTPYCGLECCKQREQNTVGLWYFSERAVHNVGVINAPQGGGTLECDQNPWGTCTFTRPRNSGFGCVELYNTTIKHAAFRDAAQNLGAAVLMGPGCKVRIPSLSLSVLLPLSACLSLSLSLFLHAFPVKTRMYLSPYISPLNSPLHNMCVPESHAYTHKSNSIRPVPLQWVEGSSPSEWDRPANATLSGVLFTSSHGSHRALQFDGVNNPGLFVSENIDDDLIHRVGGVEVEKLPQQEMTLEVFFTVSRDEVAFGGLVSVQQDGIRCHKVCTFDDFFPSWLNTMLSMDHSFISCMADCVCVCVCMCV
jgi:hypothetical protein